MERVTETDTKRKRISFFRLGVQSLPEMWTHHLAGGLVITLVMLILRVLMRQAAGTDEMLGAVGAAATGSLNWKFPIVVLLIFLMVTVTIIVEFFPHILLSDGILNGHRTNPWHEMWESAKALKRFRSPLGIVILVYVSVFLPLVYLGISMILEVEFHASWKLVDLISHDLLMKCWYYAVVGALAVLGFRSIFTVHGVLIDDLSPEAAYRLSNQIVHHHQDTVRKELLKAILVFLGIMVLTFILLTILPDYLLRKQAASLPKGVVIEWVEGISLTSLEKKVIGHRILCSLGFLLDTYGSLIITMIAMGYYMLRVTRLYYYLTGRLGNSFPERPDKNRYNYRVFIIILVFAVIGLISVANGLWFNQLYHVADSQLTDLEIIEHGLGLIFE
ncbi:MAG: glycerophosphoryl diester phosphodiesterase membrane domain-containing protein [Firmicutes bacterium]|nr:glycerophosphoryl diester phosphodiesterase membrane domain-containing protein [Bacillota bacterium]